MAEDSEPLVSIVIPTYKRYEYLEESIQSALSQTYRNIEVIVSDNAALDEVRALVEAFDDPRLRYRRNETNLGAMGNAIAAYREARGTFIGTMHDDDTWEPMAAERLMAPLVADPDLVLSFSDYWHMDANGTIDHATSEANSVRFGFSKLSPGKHRPFLDIALVDESIPLVLCTLFRKDAVDWDMVRLDVDPFTDRWLNYLLCRTGRGCYFVKERLTRYRVHEGAISASSRSYDAILRCLDAWLADPAVSSVHPALRRKLFEVRTLRGLDLLRRGERVEARAVLTESIRLGGGLRARTALAISRLPTAVTMKGLNTWTARRKIGRTDHMLFSASSPHGRGVDADSVR